MATQKRHLRVVGTDDTRPNKAVERVVPESLTDALASDRWGFLAAMRQMLVAKIEDGEIAANAVASTSKELREIDRLMRLEERATGGGGVVDDGSGEDAEFDPLAI